jgi:cob(I)alamin adenosyltransferase
MFYTGKGDKGTTKLFDTNEPEKRVPKSSCNIESLGALDELNSFCGMVKVEAEKAGLEAGSQKMSEIVEIVQNNLFTIQAEVAGSDKRIGENKTEEMEAVIDAIEESLPPVRSFLISGGTELTARLDFARTLARRAERKVVALVNSGERKVGEDTLAYLNRLSSLFYALARFSNAKSGIKEKPPTYE